MKWLIWKEFRLNWLILAIAALFLIVPYLAAVGRAAWGGTAYDIYVLVEGGWVTNAFVATIFLALLGGQSIACERADRSAEFLAYQPVSRGRILLSKLVWPGVTLVVIFGLNTAVAVFATDSVYDNLMYRRSLPGLLPFLVAAVGAFCTAWGISAWQNSPTFAVMSGIAAPLVTIWLIMMINWWMGFAMSNMLVMIVYVVAFGSLSIISFLGGSWYYLRRVEP